MGNCLGSMGVDDKEAAKRNRELEVAQEAAAKKEAEKIKLLLLGAGESGKSTIFKQMKILFGVVSDEEKRQITPVVYNNTISSMKILVDQTKAMGLEGEVQAKAAFEAVSACDEGDTIDLNRAI